MRKIIVLNYTSLDGYIAKNNDDTLGWMVYDDEVENYTVRLQEDADTLLFGRTTFEIMKNYWPTEKAAAENREIVRFMNDAKKIVFSKTLREAGWTNAELRTEIVASEIEELKRQTGKNILVYGSSSVISKLTELDLIDEYQILINPVFIGDGKPFMKNLDEILNLELLETKTFDCGDVLLRCERKKSE